jgi:hypothetical protein
MKITKEDANKIIRHNSKFYKKHITNLESEIKSLKSEIAKYKQVKKGVSVCWECEKIIPSWNKVTIMQKFPNITSKTLCNLHKECYDKIAKNSTLPLSEVKK